MLVANWRWTKDIEQQILEEIKGCQPVINVCSGSSSIGDARIDRWFDKNAYKVNCKADMCFLPIKSGIASAVICDPPYSWMRQSKHFKSLIGELARITKPSGKVIMVFPSILLHPTLNPVRFWLKPAGEKSVPTFKILSVSIKVNGQIEDYV